MESKTETIDELAKRYCKAKRSCERMRNSIILLALPTIKHIASRSKLHADAGDLISAGVIGLIDALRTFDPDLGFKFWTHAHRRVRGQMLDWCRAHDHLSRKSRSESKQIETFLELQPGATVEAIAAETGFDHQTISKLMAVSSPALSIDQKLDRRRDWRETLATTTAARAHADLVRDRNLAESVEQVLSCVTTEQRAVLTRYFLEDMTLKEAGRSIGVSESRASQLKSQAFEQINAVFPDFEF